MRTHLSLISFNQTLRRQTWSERSYWSLGISFEIITICWTHETFNVWHSHNRTNYIKTTCWLMWSSSGASQMAICHFVYLMYWIRQPWWTPINQSQKLIAHSTTEIPLNSVKLRCPVQKLRNDCFWLQMKSFHSDVISQPYLFIVIIVAELITWPYLYRFITP